MSLKYEKNLDRAHTVYDALKKEGVLQHYDDSWSGVVREVDYMLGNFVPIAKALSGASRARRLRITRATNQQAYTKLYTEGASQDHLREVMRTNQWSTGQLIDTIAVRSVSFYATLHRMSQGGLNASEEEIIENNQFVREARERMVSMATDHGLFSIIDSLVRSEKIPAGYAEDLKVLFGVADFAPGTPIGDQQAVLARVRGLLVRHRGQANVEYKKDPGIIEGVRYLERVAIGGSVDAIARLNNPDGKLDDLEVQRIQTAISKGLAAIYGGK